MGGAGDQRVPGKAPEGDRQGRPRAGQRGGEEGEGGQEGRGQEGVRQHPRLHPGNAQGPGQGGTSLLTSYRERMLPRG